MLRIGMRAWQVGAIIRAFFLWTAGARAGLLGRPPDSPFFKIFLPSRKFLIQI